MWRLGCVSTKTFLMWREIGMCFDQDNLNVERDRDVSTETALMWRGEECFRLRQLESSRRISPHDEHPCLWLCNSRY